MTCILAKIKDGKIHMIGDKMGSNGFTHGIYDKIDKVFINKDFIIGYTTSFRMGQLLQHVWTPPEKLPSETEDSYLFCKVIPSIKTMFDDNAYGEKKGVEFDGGTFIIGWKGRLFTMQDNLSLLEHSNFASVGCGTYHATAAMKTLTITKQFEKDCEKFLSTALKVAASSVSGVSETYTYKIL